MHVSQDMYKLSIYIGAALLITALILILSSGKPDKL